MAHGSTTFIDGQCANSGANWIHERCDGQEGPKKKKVVRKFSMTPAQTQLHSLDR